MAALNRVVPDDKCRIRVLENRWKYRRLAIAEKLVDLSDGGCDVSVVAFQDDLAENRVLHCQIYIRVCRPILDELRKANVHIIAAWAKPHDKVILIDAQAQAQPGEPARGSGQWIGMACGWRAGDDGAGRFGGPDRVQPAWPATKSRPSRLDPDVYDDYLQHWRQHRSQLRVQDLPLLRHRTKAKSRPAWAGRLFAVAAEVRSRRPAPVKVRVARSRHG